MAMREKLTRPGLAGLLLTFLPGVGLAADSQGLPQLDVNSYAGQLFWLAVFFAIVYGFMRFVGIPRVGALIEARHAQVAGDLGAAERLRLQAAEAQSAYEARMAEAHAQARKLLADTQEQNLATLTSRTRAAADDFDAKVGEAVQRIGLARAEALKGVAEVARGLASQITTKLAGRAPADDSVARAVDAAAQEAA
jgi:F-type H+-transporting ATPase subunit b